MEEDLAGEQVRLKRLFYALRAALAARWIRERPGGLPPMAFGPLRALLPASLEAEVEELLRRKASADEKTVVAQPAALTAFLRDELAAGQAAREELAVTRGGRESAGALDAVFRELLREAFGA